MDGREIGKVTHYFDKAMVALVRLSDNLKSGDSVKFVKGDDELEMDVASMQVDHEAINEGKGGEEVAVKVSSPVKEGAVVYRIGD